MNSNIIVSLRLRVFFSCRHCNSRVIIGHIVVDPAQLGKSVWQSVRIAMGENNIKYKKVRRIKMHEYLLLFNTFEREKSSYYK